ncbi:putative RNA recognition motif domain, cleavage stimulation factor subunit 2, hinge [Lupinus albus]|uniref:Putative RNA recognition motif domain, cleavage stimulation factor subunit 2, hinge n=1 Tax=Lupinus albus TaxID=3870 RepID=A0A6A4QXN4_LUPAL|nr:putative RNA recognition motif domain, cleavage stimulation factor subunit 2, hinge [Lupinus albus]
MASSSQHRCVFVGNIPYDATEEQLIEICQEVGPVVSFRLVVDRETGKPKGYGFCEYKDEETALSARRNLQGYQINGRQLRVDFAENDKGNDKNREQGRGGPGLTANVDSQKQVVSAAFHGEAAHHQPIGLHIAITAAAVMTAALGGAQFSTQSNQNALQSQSALAHDPLTLHLAKMSRSQLIDILSDVKAMATQNQDLARQLLLSRPQLPKALFQAQIMLGMVTSQVLQMPNLRLVSDQTSQLSIKEGQLGQPTLLQTLSGLLPHGQNQLQSGLMPYVQDGQVSSIPHNPLSPNQLTAHPKPPVQPRIQLQQHPSNHVVQLGTLPAPSNLMLPSVRPQTLGSLPVRPPIQQATLGHNNAQLVRLDASFQPGPSISSGSSQLIIRGSDTSAKVLEDLSSAQRSSTYSKAPMGLEKTNMIHDSSESFTRPSKLLKMDQGSSTYFSAGIADVPVTNGSSRVVGSSSLPVRPAPIAEVHQPPQPQVPPDVESALLQQVLNLTPEQLSSLPPEQQQQVIQLQQALRRDQMQQPS